jgi:hypothetical protein
VFTSLLREALIDQAAECEAEDNVSCEAYFTARAEEIDSGEEAYFLPIPGSVSNASDGLPDEFHETYALITSEAADVEPALVAEAQTAYEGWVMAANSQESSTSANWHARWDAAMAALNTDPATDEEQLISFYYGATVTR